MKLKTNIQTISLTAALAVLAMPGAAVAGDKADLILTNATVITVDEHDTIAEAIAIRDNRILGVGTAEEIFALRDDRTQVQDLGGRTVLPGFIDAHTHVNGMARVEAFSVNIQVPPLLGPEDIVRVLVERAAELPPGTWIWGQGTFNQVMPTREQLDAALPDHPVRLDWSAHDHMINHRAAQIMGMTSEYPEPTGMGRFERTADGEVAIIRDAPAPWPYRFVLEGEDLKKGLETILTDFFLEKGVTSVFDHVDRPTMVALQALREEGRLPVRIRASYFARPAGDKSELGGDLGIFSSGVRSNMGDDWLEMGAVKFAVDGVWGTTAYVYEPVWEGSGTSWIPHNHGGTNWDPEVLKSLIIQAHREGWQIQVHANGDRAQDITLDAFEAAQAAAYRPDPRFRIEHFGHFVQMDGERTQRRLDRMKSLNVIPSMQVAFLWRLTDRNVEEPNIQFFPVRRLIDHGLRPAGGVDTVGTQNFATSPFFSISRAVLRATKYGTVTQPEQAITVMEGIKMFTRWAAEAGFAEDDRGSLEAGKLADLIVLDRNPLQTAPTELETIQVDQVMVDGRFVHHRQ